MKCTSTSYIWAFDLGIRSIGEAIRQTTTDQNGQPQTQILHAASLLIPEKLASITDARTKRRAFRTRLAHKAREAWLDFLWQRAGLIPLRKRIPFQDNQTKKWIPELCQKADYRLEREFPPSRLLPSGTPSTSTAASPTVTFNSVGTYTVTLTASNLNGTNTATASIVVNPLPTPTLSGGGTICQGSSVNLTASGGNSFTWNTGANTASINVSPASTTTYTVTATATNGCTATATASVTVLNCSSLDEVMNTSNFLVYPNSATDMITIALQLASAEPLKAELMTTLGQVLQQ